MWGERSDSEIGSRAWLWRKHGLHQADETREACSLGCEEQAGQRGWGSGCPESGGAQDHRDRVEINGEENRGCDKLP